MCPEMPKCTFRFYQGGWITPNAFVARSLASTVGRILRLDTENGFAVLRACNNTRRDCDRCICIPDVASQRLRWCRALFDDEFLFKYHWTRPSLKSVRYWIGDTGLLCEKERSRHKSLHPPPPQRKKKERKSGILSITKWHGQFYRIYTPVRQQKVVS